MKVTYRTKSVAQAISELKKTLANIDKVFDINLTEAAQNIKEQAVSQVPVETGRLQSSIDVWVTKSHRKKHIIARASAENENTGYNYAKIQHEVNMRHPNGGKWHYISDPFYTEINKLNERLEKEILK